MGSNPDLSTCIVMHRSVFDMKTSLFDYRLPKNLIANSPAHPRDHSRLMIIDRKTGQINHCRFFEIENYLGPNDVLVLNKTKVFPARIFAKKITGGNIEILFLEEIKPGIWTTLTHPGVKAGTNIALNKFLFNAIGQEGVTAIIDTHLTKTVMMDVLRKYGHTPLPPYIDSKEKESDLRKEYQTIYAKTIGSVAAPTAGFHFTKRLLTSHRGADYSQTQGCKSSTSHSMLAWEPLFLLNPRLLKSTKCTRKNFLLTEKRLRD